MAGGRPGGMTMPRPAPGLHLFTRNAMLNCIPVCHCAADRHLYQQSHGHACAKWASARNRAAHSITKPLFSKTKI